MYVWASLVLVAGTHVPRGALKFPYEDEAGCTIDEYAAGSLDAKRFAREYQGRRAVVLRGAALTWPSANWTWEGLLQQAGHVEVQTGVSRVLTERGGVTAQGRVSLADFVREEMPALLGEGEEGRGNQSEVHCVAETKVYAFDQDDFFLDAAEMREELRFDHSALPLVPQRRHHQTLYIGVGQECTGLEWHRHNEAVNVQVLGRKLWHVAGAMDYREAWEQMPVVKWIRDVRDPDIHRHCTLGPGDAIYVPHRMGHATLNLEASLAVAVQFSSPRTRLLQDWWVANKRLDQQRWEEASERLAAYREFTASLPERCTEADVVGVCLETGGRRKVSAGERTIQGTALSVYAALKLARCADAVALA
eukprot:Hpha_TRINITY_DN9868_c0_g1::TRINITY_DN9868_c0_g1_i1::g.81392::m.81392